MNEYPNTHLFSRDSYFYYMENGEIKSMVITKGDVNAKYYRYKKKWSNKMIHYLENSFELDEIHPNK